MLSSRRLSDVPPGPVWITVFIVSNWFHNLLSKTTQGLSKLWWQWAYNSLWKINQRKTRHSYVLFKKHGWDAIYKNIILSMFGFLNGCFVLFNGGGTRPGAWGVSWWEWAAGWRMTYSVSVSLSKSPFDEFWSADADKQEVAFSYPNMSQHEKTVYCMSAPYALLGSSIAPPLHNPPQISL